MSEAQPGDMASLVAKLVRDYDEAAADMKRLHEEFGGAVTAASIRQAEAVDALLRLGR